MAAPSAVVTTSTRRRDRRRAGRAASRRLTGGQIVAEMLVREGTPYVVGIPGHGNLGLVDAFRSQQEGLQVIVPRHEQSAVHIADGFFRASGTPLACFTSIGPGAMNTAVGLGTAYVDSVPVLALTGSVHVHMRGTGVLQELERRMWAESARVLEPTCKKILSVDSARQLPRAVSTAFRLMLTGRPGPVLIDLPMDVQGSSSEVVLPPPYAEHAISPPSPDGPTVRRCAEVLSQARRPVLLLGGGVTLARAGAQAVAVSELFGAVMLTTMQGKGSVPEDHPLYGAHPGSNGTTDGNAFARDADVILAVGVRFADKATSSYRHGTTFAIPPTRLIQVDIDPAEIGKNYPVEIGVVSDAGSFLQALAATMAETEPPIAWAGSPRARAVAESRTLWRDSFRELRESVSSPITMARALSEMRAALPSNAIILTSSGHTQSQVFQELEFVQPGTYMSAGGFSTMGWSLPAALGAKLADPQRAAVAVIGDGDFLMTVQELATAVQYRIPVVVIVFNSFGWQSIRDLQTYAYGSGSEFATSFQRDGGSVGPDVAAVARAFGAHGEQVTNPGEMGPAVERALRSGVPSVIEVFHDTTFGRAGGQAPGWWDVPVPTYRTMRRLRYESAMNEEVV